MPQQDTSQIKEKIMSFLRNNGPSIPIKIGKEIEQNGLFTSAFLSELLSEKRINMSNMRVGSSSIYFIPGQEKGLENYIQHLKPREREAFELLKTNKILEDRKQEPAIRVALRSIKDFAIPIQREEELFWKYFQANDEEIKIPERIPETIQKENPIQQRANILETKKEDEEELSEKVRKYIADFKIKLLEEIEVKKRDYLGIARIQSEVGEMEILIIGKSKKSLTKKDLEKFIEETKKHRRASLVLIDGEIHKNSKEEFRKYKNIINVKKLEEKPLNNQTEAI